MTVTQNLRTMAVFAAGLTAGIAIAGGMLLAERPGSASTMPAVSASTAPDQAWNASATAAVNDLRSRGIIVAPSVAKYDGSSYVTRYEAAVLIDRFVHYVENGRKPLHPTTIDSAHMPNIPDGAAHAQMVDLVKNRYIVPNSALVQSPITSPVTAQQLSDAMTSTVNRIIDRSLKPVGNGEVED